MFLIFVFFIQLTGSYVAKRIQTLKPFQKKARLAFAKKYTGIDWSQVVFSDEKTLQSGSHSKPRVRRPFTEDKNPKYRAKVDDKRVCKVNLWSYVTREGVGELYLAKGVLVGYTMIKNKKVPKYSYNGDAYDKIIKEAIPKIKVQIGDFKFVQDKVPFHYNKKTMKYLKDEKIDVLDWAPVSPDLNIIEN